MMTAGDEEFGSGSLSPKTYSISEYRHLLAKLKSNHQTVAAPTAPTQSPTISIPALNSHTSLTEGYRRERIIDKSDVLRRAMDRINRQRAILPTNIAEPSAQAAAAAAVTETPSSLSSSTSTSPVIRSTYTDVSPPSLSLPVSPKFASNTIAQSRSPNAHSALPPIVPPPMNAAHQQSAEQLRVRRHASTGMIAQSEHTSAMPTRQPRSHPTSLHLAAGLFVVPSQATSTSASAILPQQRRVFVPSLPTAVTLAAAQSLSPPISQNASPATSKAPSPLMSPRRIRNTKLSDAMALSSSANDIPHENQPNNSRGGPHSLPTSKAVSRNISASDEKTNEDDIVVVSGTTSSARGVDIGGGMMTDDLFVAFDELTAHWHTIKHALTHNTAHERMPVPLLSSSLDFQPATSATAAISRLVRMIAADNNTINDY